MKTPLITIVGPTASGKSAFAMQVAQQFNGEIICADSRTVYKGMDIGTAKPTQADRARVRHHLLDVIEPDQQFTAADFNRLANNTINDIARRGKLPILVGGTGLYVDAVIFDYQFGGPADPARRAALNAMDVAELQELCINYNIPIPSNRTNKRHLIRAIELGGLPERKNNLRPNTLVVGIATEREELKERIASRAQDMLAAGVIEETEALAARYGWGSEAMKANIYRIFRGVLEGSKTEVAALQEFVQSDMLLAKRQLTWLKRNPQIIWGTPAELLERVTEFVHPSAVKS